jgi:hypothetical protein
MLRILLLLLISSIYSHSEAQIQPKLLSNFPSVIDENSQIWNISLNEDHFLINRGDNRTVYLFNIIHEDSQLKPLSKLHIRKGRGPGESTALTYAELSDSLVLMLSPNEHKYMLYDISAREKQEFSSKYSFSYADFSNGHFNLYPNLDPNIISASINNLKQPENLDVVPIDKEFYSTAQRGKNFFYHTGKAQHFGGKYVLASSYWPFFLQYNESGTGSKSWFDSVSDYEPFEEYSDGSRILLPPENPDLKLRDFSVLQIDQQQYFALVYDGNSHDREYGLKNVIIIDQHFETAVKLSTEQEINRIDTFSNYLGILLGDGSVSIYEFE